jgi:hypothetical protein
MKYFKIVSSTKYHFGIKYDVKKNDRYDDIKICDVADPTTGLHFSRENILSYLNYGDYVMDVEIPLGVDVYQISDDTWKAQSIYLSNPRILDMATINSLIQEGADPRCYQDTPLILAAQKGNIDLVEYLHNVHGADLSTQNHYAYHLAMYNKPRNIANPRYMKYNKTVEYIIFNTTKEIKSISFTQIISGEPDNKPVDRSEYYQCSDSNKIGQKNEMTDNFIDKYKDAIEIISNESVNDYPDDQNNQDDFIGSLITNNMDSQTPNNNDHNWDHTWEHNDLDSLNDTISNKSTNYSQQIYEDDVWPDDDRPKFIVKIASKPISSYNATTLSEEYKLNSLDISSNSEVNSLDIILPKTYQNITPIKPVDPFYDPTINDMSHYQNIDIVRQHQKHQANKLKHQPSNWVTFY